MALFGFTEKKIKKEVDPKGHVGSDTVGLRTKPIFIENGVPKAIDYSINKNVPTGAWPVADGGSGQTGTTTASCTLITDSTLSSTTNTIAKWGNVITLRLALKRSTSWYADGVQVATIPSGYRPKMALTADTFGATSDVSNSRMRWEIGTDGKIVTRYAGSFYKSANKVATLQITYVIA